MKNQNRDIFLLPLKDENVISFFSFIVKSKYKPSRLYDELLCSLQSLNRSNACYLSTYPYIAVHVLNGNSDYLASNRDSIKATIKSILFEMQE
jgi:hypothetical protein